MKRSLIAAATLLSSAGGVYAQSSVQIYGIVDAYVESARVTGKDAMTRVSTNGSAPSLWGLRGSEDLGGGLKASFVLESGFAIDSGVLLQGGRMFGRRATVSLSSPDAGDVHLGRNYAPIHYSMLSTSADGFTATSPMFAMYQSNLDQSRHDNQISYFSPSLGGFSGVASISAGENEAVATNLWIPGAGTSKNKLGAMLRYKEGPVDTSIAFHSAGQKLTAGGESEQRSWHAGLKYKTSIMDIGANLWHHRNELPTGIAPTTRGVAVGATVPVMPQLSLVAQIARVQDDGQVYATGAAKAKGTTSYINLGGDYRLSKRTAIYMRYAHVKDKNSGFNGRATAALAGMFGPGNALPAGGTASTLAVGMRHTF